MTIKISRLKALEELRREVHHRRKAWPMADKKENRFLKQNHQNQYDILILIGCIFKTMTDKEYFNFIKKYQRQKKENNQKLKNKIFKKIK